MDRQGQRQDRHPPAQRRRGRPLPGMDRQRPTTTRPAHPDAQDRRRSHSADHGRSQEQVGQGLIASSGAGFIRTGPLDDGEPAAGVADRLAECGWKSDIVDYRMDQPDRPASVPHHRSSSPARNGRTPRNFAQRAYMRVSFGYVHTR